MTAQTDVKTHGASARSGQAVLSNPTPTMDVISALTRGRSTANKKEEGFNATDRHDIHDTIGNTGSDRTNTVIAVMPGVK